MTSAEHERGNETQEVPDAERGGVRKGRDTVTWLQLCGTDTLCALPRLRREIKHYTLGSAPDQDVVISSSYVSRQRCRLSGPDEAEGGRSGEQNGTYFAESNRRQADDLNA